MLQRLRRSVDRRGKQKFRFECVRCGARWLNACRACFARRAPRTRTLTRTRTPARRATVEVVGLSAWPKGFTQCTVQLVRPPAQSATSAVAPALIAAASR